MKSQIDSFLIGKGDRAVAPSSDLPMDAIGKLSCTGVSSLDSLVITSDVNLNGTFIRGTEGRLQNFQTQIRTVRDSVDSKIAYHANQAEFHAALAAKHRKQKEKMHDVLDMNIADFAEILRG